MNIFSRIYFLFLAFAVIAGSFSQVQLSSVDEFSHPTETGSISHISKPDIWGIVNVDGESSSLQDITIARDSDEDQKSNQSPECAFESILKNTSFGYLYFSRSIESSLAIREMLYPFHFYF